MKLRHLQKLVEDALETQDGIDLNASVRLYIDPRGKLHITIESSNQYLDYTEEDGSLKRQLTYYKLISE